MYPPPPQCVMCHVSDVTCHVSHVTCHLFFFFFWQSGDAFRWKVCYQQGLPRLVYMTRDGHMTCDTWNMTNAMLQVKCDIWRVTCDTQWVVKDVSKFPDHSFTSFGVMMSCDTWHMIWHLALDTWLVKGDTQAWWTYSQNYRSLAVTVLD